MKNEGDFEIEFRISTLPLDKGKDDAIDFRRFFSSHHPLLGAKEGRERFQIFNSNLLDHGITQPCGSLLVGLIVQHPVDDFSVEIEAEVGKELVGNHHEVSHVILVEVDEDHDQDPVEVLLAHDPDASGHGFLLRRQG